MKTQKKTNYTYTHTHTHTEREREAVYAHTKANDPKGISSEHRRRSQMEESIVSASSLRVTVSPYNIVDRAPVGVRSTYSSFILSYLY
jgi:hypothetical protein